MAEPSLTFLGEQLRSIQADLRGSNAYDVMVREVGAALGTFEAKIDHRLNGLSEQLDALTGQFNIFRAELGAKLDRIINKKENR